MDSTTRSQVTPPQHREKPIARFALRCPLQHWRGVYRVWLIDESCKKGSSDVRCVRCLASRAPKQGLLFCARNGSQAATKCDERLGETPWEYSIRG